MPSPRVCIHFAAALFSDSTRSLVAVSSPITRWAAFGSASAARSASNCISICWHTAATSAAASADTAAAPPAATRSVTNETSSANPDSPFSAVSLVFTARDRSDDDTAISGISATARRCPSSSCRTVRQAG